MPIFTGGGTARRGRFLETLPAPMLDVLGASGREALVRNPVASINRLSELKEAEHGELPRDFDEFDAVSGRLGAGRPQRTPESPLLSAEEARARVEREGLDLKVPDGGIRQEALDILIERKRAERRRQSILARAPQGFTPALLQFGTALGASMLDPINIAASFVPVVGPARYARMLAKAPGRGARAAVRARVGAAEGAAGAALVEPIVYAGARAEQADYDLADSAMNVVFGTALGAGLHTGLGAVSDALARGADPRTARPVEGMAEEVAAWSPQERQQALDLAVKQAMAGRNVDVQPYVDLRDALGEVRPASIAEARRQALDSLRQEFDETLRPEAERALPRKQVQDLRGEQRRLQNEMEQLDGSFRRRARNARRREGLDPEQAEARARQEIETERAQRQSRLDEIDEELRAQEVAEASRADLARLERGETPERFTERVEQEAQRLYRGFGRQTPLDARVREAIGRNPPPRAVEAWSALHAAARNQGEPERVRLVDTALADEITLEMRQAPEEPDLETARAELGEEMQRLDEMARALDDEEAQARLAEFDEAIEQAEAYGNGLRQVALCSFRRMA